MRRILAASVAVPLVGLLAGCGSNAATPAVTPVHLSLSGPVDGTRVTTGSVLISGTVSPPDATVLVAGRGVAVASGSFQARVPLAPGQNIVDVLAGAPRAHAAMEAVRVFRQVNVTVPPLSGRTIGAATATLRASGLTARIVENEPFYAFLLPGLADGLHHLAGGRPLSPARIHRYGRSFEVLLTVRSLRRRAISSVG